MFPITTDELLAPHVLILLGVISFLLLCLGISMYRRASVEQSVQSMVRELEERDAYVGRLKKENRNGLEALTKSRESNNSLRQERLEIKVWLTGWSIRIKRSEVTGKFRFFLAYQGKFVVGNPAWQKTREKAIAHARKHFPEDIFPLE